MVDREGKTLGVAGRWRTGIWQLVGWSPWENRSVMKACHGKRFEDVAKTEETRRSVASFHLVFRCSRIDVSGRRPQLSIVDQLMEGERGRELVGTLASP